MNVIPPRFPRGTDDLASSWRGASPSVFAQRVADTLLGKIATVVLATVALVTGLVTFVVLSGGLTLTRRPHLDIALLIANAAALLLLGLSVVGRVARVWLERRRGAAGARLHVRLVMLFSVVAIIPTLVVAFFASVLFHVGIQAWFNVRVHTALEESLAAARGYLTEHNDAIRSDAMNLSEDLTVAHAGELVIADPEEVTRILLDQGSLNGLTEATLFDPVTLQVMASMGASTVPAEPPPSMILKARSGEVAILDSPDHTTVRAWIALHSPQMLMLEIARPVDPVILGHMQRTEEAVAEYDRLDRHRSGLQITFVLIFALIALLVLAVAALIGLVLANQIARPLGALIVAAERVRTGDLGVRVAEGRADDEVAGLSRAFNRMTDQLSSQRTELMSAYSQIDERRRFTETVLSGVSAGVIGLDAEQRIELPNRAASELLGADLLAAVAHRMAEVVPEFSPLLAEARNHPDRPHIAELSVRAAGRQRTLLVRTGAEMRGGRFDGFVVTFDDITELQAAQRKAAWADVARRIAHEIKNPLTPIQLSAERLKRRFLREIQSDPETFAQCADTIVRSVGDIGRMVDEFSAFARMPQPVMKDEDVGRVAREALILQRDAHPEITWTTAIAEPACRASCDRRLLGQAVTNLLLNAAESIAMRKGDTVPAGQVTVAVEAAGQGVRIAVADNGVGLPSEDHDRLTEPYVTHKPRGTGLGLAIVKKIMEDHGGTVTLDDRPEHGGAIAILTLPLRDHDGA